MTPSRVAYGAHALHDGFTDLLYGLLPLLQAEFGLSYAHTGLIKSVYSAMMAGFQTPAAALAPRPEYAAIKWEPVNRKKAYENKIIECAF